MSKILFISALSSKRLVDEVHVRTQRDPGFAVQKFNRLIVDGFQKNDCEVFVYSSAPVNAIAGKSWVSMPAETEDNITYHYARFLNMPILKSAGVLLGTFWKTVKFGLKNKKDKIVVSDVLAVGSNIGAMLACKLTGLRIVGIVTDMPGLMVDASGINSKRPSMLRRLISWSSTCYLHSYSYYVFLTEQMNEVINIHNKPYIVMEAVCDGKIKINDDSNHRNCNIKKIMYAGGLHEKYGLKALVEGFCKLNRQDIKLVLYGSGPYANDIKRIANVDSRIEYRGTASNDVIVQEELDSYLLVNPRPTKEAFTKYSFPSKNMEYMVSGTPVLTTMLPGMPKSYYDYVYLISEESSDGIAKALNYVLSLDTSEVRAKGKRAKHWVLENKNNVVQTKRILELACSC